MSKTIKLDHITKIEGHANLTVAIDKGRVKKC
jgi:coenzyme F420-reducing hydrogenase alpha subunit